MGQVAANKYFNSGAYIWKNGDTTLIEPHVPELESENRAPYTGVPSPVFYARAASINDSGQVVGTLYGEYLYGSAPFLWQNGATEVLYNGYELDPFANDINNSGQVVYSFDGNACLWEKGEQTELIDWGGGGWIHEAAAINDSGQVVGDAYLWEDGAFTELGTLENGDRSRANDINNSGQVVGWSTIEAEDYTRHAFLWEQGTIIDLGTLGGGVSEALSINDRGQVVGKSWTATGGWHAFLWENGLMVDLNEILGQESEWEMVAVGINNLGQIIGTGRNSMGDLRGILLNPSDAPAPVPEPATMLLTGFGLAGAGLSGLRRRKKKS